jgi:hypothetical protein
MGPAQAPLPCSTGVPIANSALLAVFPHPKKAACFDGMYNEGNSDGLDYY